MGELIDLEAYRRRKHRGLPRLATSRGCEPPASPSAPGPSAPDGYRLGLPKPSKPSKPAKHPDDPDAPEPA